MLQTVIPPLRLYLPVITVHSTSDMNTPANVSSAELLNLLVGCSNLVCFYLLFHAVSRRQSTSLHQNVVFLSLSFLITTGMGLHSVCVALEEQFQMEKEQAALVHIFHEYFSHSMFMIGFYATLTLIAYTEHKAVAKPTSTTRNHWIDWATALMFGSFLTVFSIATTTHLWTGSFFIVMIFFNFKVAVVGDLPVCRILNKMSIFGLLLMFILAIYSPDYY